MELPPFVPLNSPRAVDRPDLPSDLRRFYEQHEGVGLESEADRMVRLCMLAEVAITGWRDVHILGSDDSPPWNTFQGIRIGVSLYFDEILYVLSSPCCATGAVLAIGPDIGGPGGHGSDLDLLEPSLVLAESFDAWIQHLKECDWEEYGLTPGRVAELPAPQQRIQWQHYKRLNPQLQWEEPA